MRQKLNVERGGQSSEEYCIREKNFSKGKSKEREGKSKFDEGMKN
jgi:hypothetical protein